MMVWRSKLILTLLETYRVTVFLTESDAVWNADAAAYIRAHYEGYDFLTINNKPHQRGGCIQGGFQYLNATVRCRFVRPWFVRGMCVSIVCPVTSERQCPYQACPSVQEDLVALYRHHATTYWAEMDAYRNYSETAFIPVSDQLHLDPLVKSYKPLKWAYLDQRAFAAGMWYQDKRVSAKTPRRKQPVVILNNWITGNEAKMKRAKQWGHWYLSDDDPRLCVDPHREPG